MHGSDLLSLSRLSPMCWLFDEVHEAIDESFRSELECRVKRIRCRGEIVVCRRSRSSDVGPALRSNDPSG